MTTAAVHADAPGAHTPTVGSLLVAELLRVRSRRLVRIVSLGLFAIIALVAVVGFIQSAKPTSAQITEARTACAQEPAFDENGEEILTQPGATASDCTVREAAQYGAFDKRPHLRSDIPEEILGVGVGVAVLAFILGCTVGGADWSQKTMAALLFWEPRRVRVFFVKLAALVISLVALLAVAVLVWVAIKSLLITTHGVWSDGEPSIVGASFDYFGRSALLVVTMGAFAYGIASLARNTGAALGIGFVYFAIVEIFVQWLFPRLAPWMLTTNIGALVTPGGQPVVRNGVETVVSPFQGGVVLVVYAAVVCVVGLELFRRRDVT